MFMAKWAEFCARAKAKDHEDLLQSPVVLRGDNHLDLRTFLWLLFLLGGGRGNSLFVYSSKPTGRPQSLGLNLSEARRSSV